ncbi:MAG: UDP-N-acetylglucosamine 1-carboxyvinyltransferase [Ignavibacteriae bacterium]|nr:UDP-N-acetylglucosamine 1-carboxyvinyltransferase [Ignavibacteriota bacterium]NOG98269.1 UDP-N-acetylglucosamine 1-carboxyvinyltransferase [Ignavibacteriota bacterium]
MDKYLINGGIPLKGKVKASGAKNSALALMPATLLSSGKNIIRNTPEVNDIFTMKKLLTFMGADVSFENHVLEIDTDSLNTQVAPYEHVKKMRASVYVLGPLLARYGYTKVSMPGGCAWGPRPINLHLEAMEKLGAKIELEEGYIIAECKKLQGAKIHFDIPSVGATGNALMASVLAKGSTQITNAAIEPEITLLAEYLKDMGAHIDGVGTSTLEIEGVDELKAAEVENISDRIEAGTLLIAGAITKGEVEVETTNVNHLTSVLKKLEKSGVKVFLKNNIININASELSIKNVNVDTSVYPGFPTDMQAQWTAFMCLADGISRVTDNIYFDRFKHVPELNRLGASIEVDKNSAIISGVNQLKGAKVMSTDLRASASLVLAGLAAEGTTEVLRIYHIDRGYQKLEEKLRSLGADIQRVDTEEF